MLQEGTLVQTVPLALEWKQETGGLAEEEAVLFSSSLCLGQHLLAAVVLASTR